MFKKNIFKFIVVALMVLSLTSCDKEKEATEHIHAWGNWETVVEATCKEEGKMERQCTGCEEVDSIILNMIAHKFDEGTITKEATCKEEGIIKFNCSVCSKFIEQKIPTIPHKEVLDLGTMPTCSASGVSNGSHCELCDTVLVKQEVLEPVGHAWGKQVTKKAPTCSESGQAQVTCSTCKSVSLVMLAPLGHHVIEEGYSAPTCENMGYVGKTYCDWCNEELSVNETIQPIGHNFVNGECVRCQTKETKEGMKFKLINGEYYLSDVGIILTPTVYVPVMYNNTYVVGILNEAFDSAEYVNAIYLPNTIREIEDGAFNGCRYLQRFILDDNHEYFELSDGCLVDKATKVLIAGAANSKIENGIVEIASEAFKNRIGLTIIDIPASVEKIAEDAFIGCNNIVLIKVDEGNKVYSGNGNSIILKESNTLLLGCQGTKIEEGIEVIASGAFDSCEMLYDITLPSTVTTIMPKAFTRCLFVSKLYISENVTMLDGAFEGLTSLTKIEVAKENPNYKSVDNCIVSKDGKTLVLSNAEGIIPEGVEIIGAGAFAGNVNLKTVTLPETIKEIGARAFADCTNLTTVLLSPVVTTIGEEAFAGCTNFDKIIIPDSVTTIKKGAFTGCENMQRIELSDKITVIEEDAFKDCTILIIVCEAKKKPAGWYENYNPEHRPEFWGVYIIN